MVQTHSITCKRTFKHLTTYKRGLFAALYGKGESMQDIANSAGYDCSIIWRKLKHPFRNTAENWSHYVRSLLPRDGLGKIRRKSESLQCQTEA